MVRDVQHAMRRIQQLRGATDQMQPALTDTQRTYILSGLSTEIRELDKQLLVEHETCVYMQETCAQMHQRLVNLRRAALLLLDGET